MRRTVIFEWKYPQDFEAKAACLNAALRPTARVDIMVVIVRGKVSSSDATEETERCRAGNGVGRNTRHLHVIGSDRDSM